jgi:hypothetical protein
LRGVCKERHFHRGRRLFDEANHSLERARLFDIVTLQGGGQTEKILLPRYKSRGDLRVHREEDASHLGRVTAIEGCRSAGNGELSAPGVAHVSQRTRQFVDPRHLGPIHERGAAVQPKSKAGRLRVTGVIICLIKLV